MVTRRKTGRKLASVAAAIVLLVGACGGERFTSDDPGAGEAGTSKGGSASGGSKSGSGGASTSGGARTNGGSKSAGGVSGEANAHAGEFGNGGSAGGGRDGGGRDGGGRAGADGGENAGGVEGGEGGAAAGTGGARAGSGGTAGGTGGTLGGTGGKTGGTGGTLGGTGGTLGGTGGKTGGTGGTLGGTGGSIVVAGAGAGGASPECQVPTGATLILDEQFNADVFNGTGWTRTDTSVSVAGGLFKIASDGQYDDYGDLGMSASAPLIVEVRLRNVSGGSDELIPVVEVHFGTDSSGVVSITYNPHPGYGWIFGPPGVNTGSTIEGPASEGVWTTIRAFMRVGGGTLCAKRDDETNFTYVGTSSWQLPKSITHLRLRQNYDDVSEVDRVVVRQQP